MQTENHSYWSGRSSNSRSNSWSHWSKERRRLHHSDHFNHWHRSSYGKSNGYRSHQPNRSHKLSNSFHHHPRWERRDYFHDSETEYPEYFTTDQARHTKESYSKNVSYHDTAKKTEASYKSSASEKNVEQTNKKDFTPCPSSCKESLDSCPSLTSKDSNKLADDTNSSTEEKKIRESTSEEGSKKTPFVEKSISNLISKLFSEKTLQSSTKKSTDNVESCKQSKIKSEGTVRSKVGTIETAKKETVSNTKMRFISKSQNGMNYSEYKIGQSLNRKGCEVFSENRKSRFLNKRRSPSPKIENSLDICFQKDLSSDPLVKSRLMPNLPLNHTVKNDNFKESDVSELHDSPPELSPQKSSCIKDGEEILINDGKSGSKDHDSGTSLEKNLETLDFNNKYDDCSLTEVPSLFEDISESSKYMEKPVCLHVPLEKIECLQDVLSSVMKTSISQVIKDKLQNNPVNNEAVLDSVTLKDGGEIDFSCSSTSSKYVKSVDSQHFINGTNNGEKAQNERSKVNVRITKKPKNMHNHFNNIAYKTRLTIQKRNRKNLNLNSQNINVRSGIVRVNCKSKASHRLAAITRKKAIKRSLIERKSKKKKKRHFKGGTYDLYLSCGKRKKQKANSADAKYDIDGISMGESETVIDSLLDSEDSSTTLKTSGTATETSQPKKDDLSNYSIISEVGDIKNNKPLFLLSSVMKTSLSDLLRASLKLKPRTDTITDPKVLLNISEGSIKHAQTDKVPKLSPKSNLLSLQPESKLKSIVNISGAADNISSSSSSTSLFKFLHGHNYTSKGLNSKQTLSKAEVTNALSESIGNDSSLLTKQTTLPEAVISLSALKQNQQDDSCSITNNQKFSLRLASRQGKDFPRLPGESSIASGVKKRQRIKHKFPEDHVDVDAVSLSSDSEESCQKPNKKKKVIDYESPVDKENSRQSAESLSASKISQSIPTLTRPPLHKLVITRISAPKSDSPDQKANSNGSIFSAVSVPKDDLLMLDEKEPEFIACTCQGKTLDRTSTLPQDGLICQAVDSMDERLVNCANNVTSHNLVRPSIKIPYTAMCEVHLSRLRKHQCCPNCGVFCTQGKFQQCVMTGSHNRTLFHFFHKHCQAVDRNTNMPACPHCGNPSEFKMVRLELNIPSCQVAETDSSTISFDMQQVKYGTDSNDCDADATSIEEELSEQPSTATEIETSVNLKLPSKKEEPQKLTLGPDQYQHGIMLKALCAERPLNLRYTAKSFYSTVKSGDVDKVLSILASGFNPNHVFVDHNRNTALHIAAQAGWSVIVHLLVQSGSYLDHMNLDLYTPLMVAIENNHIGIAHYLISSGAQLCAKGEDGTTPLHLAARCGSEEICRMILDTGKVNVNVQDDGGWTALVWAAEYNHLDCVKLLLSRGADPSIRDNEQNISLHWSAFSGNVDISQMFLDMGCNLKTANEHGDTPLHIAARQASYECVVLFLARGASTDLTNKDGETPLMCCIKDTQAWMALSMHYELKKRQPTHGHRTEKILSNDISKGKETNPIQCVNSYDSADLPTDYLYIVENCETKLINIDRTITSLQRCHCVDDCSSNSCTCSSFSFKCWYDKNGCLLPDFDMVDPPMLFECNRACLCWKNCRNRVFQHGIVCRLQLFRTKGKGWGVRPLKDIPKGTFICEYIGEILSDSDANERKDDSYLFDLDNKEEETFCLDARIYGNISRFINHLCEPNLIPVKVFVDHQDIRFPRIAFFSVRDIKAYEELGFDYGEKFWMVKYKSFLCVCGSPKCKYSKDSIDSTLERYFLKQQEEQEAYREES